MSTHSGRGSTNSARVQPRRGFDTQRVCCGRWAQRGLHSQRCGCQRASKARLAYAGIWPRNVESARDYRKSDLVDDTGATAVEPTSARPSFAELAEMAKELSSAVADARIRNSLDEIRQVAVALSAKLRRRRTRLRGWLP